MSTVDIALTWKIMLDGSPLDDALQAMLLELRVETTTELPDVCVLRFAESHSAERDELTIIDDERLKLGAPLSVKLAAQHGGAPKPVFDGEITTVEAEFGARPGADSALELVVTAHDRSHRMHRKTTTRTFRQMTVSDVARKMAGEHGLKVGTIASIGGSPNEVLHQVGETDWAFLSQLVNGHGGELDIAGGALHVIDPAKSVAPVAELTWGETIERYRPRISSLGQVEKVIVRGWDPKKKKEITRDATAKSGSPTEGKTVKSDAGGTEAFVVTAPVASDGDAKDRAEAVAGRVGRQRVQADAVVFGDPRLLAGEYVDIKGVGKRFGGKQRIVSAVHVVGPRGYRTRLTLGAGGRPLAQTLRGAQGSAGFADHLAIGLVTDNKDPDKLGRVKVSYPSFAGSVESGWARVVRPASGKERGIVALPHVSDEVVVGFEHGDVRRPFVLGALFNGRDTPGADLLKTTSSLAARFPRDLDVKTDEKVLLTAGKDVTVKSEQGPIEVAAGKAMTLSASKGGPPSAMTIETTGQVKMNGKQGVEISATGPLKITSAAPVTVESNAVLQLKGSVIQVQASGILQLSGATVMIG